MKKEINIRITFNSPSESVQEFTDYLNLRLVKKINQIINWTSGVEVDKLVVLRDHVNSINLKLVLECDNMSILNRLTTKINKKLHRKLHRLIRWFRFWYRDVYINSYLLTSEFL